MNKTIVITGTTRGIGLALAEYYLKGGWTVLGCSKSESKIDHKSYFHYQIDVGNRDEVGDFFVEIASKNLFPYALINNAGIMKTNLIFRSNPTDFEDIIQTNYLGTYYMMKGFVKLTNFRDGQHGRIINVSSVAVPQMFKGEAAYASSKAAVETLTKVASKEFARQNITVNAIGPNPIKTDIIEHLSEDQIDALLKSQAVRRLGTFEDVINVADFYLSPKSDLITGQVIYFANPV